MFVQVNSSDLFVFRLDGSWELRGASFFGGWFVLFMVPLVAGATQVGLDGQPGLPG